MFSRAPVRQIHWYNKVHVDVDLNASIRKRQRQVHQRVYCGI